MPLVQLAPVLRVHILTPVIPPLTFKHYTQDIDNKQVKKGHEYKVIEDIAIYVG